MRNASSASRTRRATSSAGVGKRANRRYGFSSAGERSAAATPNHVESRHVPARVAPIPRDGHVVRLYPAAIGCLTSNMGSGHDEHVFVQRRLDDLGTPLSEVTFCVLDLETTGASPE